MLPCDCLTGFEQSMHTCNPRLPANLLLDLCGKIGMNVYAAVEETTAMQRAVMMRTLRSPYPNGPEDVPSCSNWPVRCRQTLTRFSSSTGKHAALMKSLVTQVSHMPATSPVTLHSVSPSETASKVRSAFIEYESGSFRSCASFKPQNVFWHLQTKPVNCFQLLDPSLPYYICLMDTRQ